MSLSENSWLYSLWWQNKKNIQPNIFHYPLVLWYYELVYGDLFAGSNIISMTKSYVLTLKESFTSIFFSKNFTC